MRTRFSPARCCCGVPPCRGVCGDERGAAAKLWFWSSLFDAVELTAIHRPSPPPLTDDNDADMRTYCRYGYAGSIPMPGSALVDAADMPIIVSVQHVTTPDATDVWRPANYVRIMTPGRVTGYADKVTSCGAAPIVGHQAAPERWGEYSFDVVQGYIHDPDDPALLPPGDVPALLLQSFMAICEDTPFPGASESSYVIRRFADGRIDWTQNINPPSAGRAHYHFPYYLYGGEGCPGTGSANRFPVDFSLSLTPPASRGYPSLAKQAANLAKSATKFVASGGATVSQEEFDRRRAICQSCPTRRYVAAEDRCSACGCYLAIKPWGKAEACPDGHW